MNKSLIFLFFFSACGTFVPVNAQQSRSASSYSKEASAIVTKYQKQIAECAKNATSLEKESDDTSISPYLYKLLGPGIFYRSALEDGFKLNYNMPWQQNDMTASDAMNYQDRMNASVNEVLFNTYASNPSVFHYYDAQIASENIVAPASDASEKKEDLTDIYNKVEEIKDVADVVDNVDVDIHIEKPNFWKTSGKFSLQFTQNYFSENWYKGGNNNVTLLSNLVLEANYNDQKRLSWDNKLDLRLGFITATSDSIHRYLTNNDKINLFSKLGVKAAKSWHYTVSVEANSQFLPGYRSNDRHAYSKFISPLDVFISLGMDFKPSLKNGNTFSLELLPFSYKMRYISDAEETIHSSYNMVGKNFQKDYGSKVVLNSKLTLAKNFTWRCRFYYFTSYKYAESELENVFSFQFNKYISSEVNTLWRFDDNRNKQYYDSTLGYFQFKEYFTLGLAYNF